MKARGAAVQGGLAVVALIAAYFGWQREPDRAQEEVVALDAKASELQSIRFDDGKKWVSLERRGPGDAVWVIHGNHPAPVADGGAALDAGTVSPDAGALAISDGGVGKGDGGTADAGTRPLPPPPPPAAPPIVRRELRGNDLAQKLLERFAPFRATRALGTLPDEKLRELGLSSSPRSLEIKLKGGTHRFTVSAASPTGGAPYFQSGDDGKVYLVSATLLSDLDAASTRLVERRLLEFKQGEYDEVVLRTGGKERAFVQTGVAPQVKVAPKSAPDSSDEFARNWLDKVFRFVPTEILGKGETPASGEPELDTRVEYLAKGKPLGFIELGRGTGNQLFARSHHSAGWVRVQLGAKEVLDDAKRLVEAR